VLPMTGYKISEAARATGFSMSALRFYQLEGVVVPERTTTGYRSYRDNDLDSLRFVARGKQLGLSLRRSPSCSTSSTGKTVHRCRPGSGTS
jgi:hypothetical protein